MIPSFRHMGGKARLRKWLVSLMPKECETYVEPFVGKGNVFFAARGTVKANAWKLDDIDCRFLRALQCANLDELPELVGRDDYTQWKNNANHPISILLEPRITFAGKGYKHGFSGSSGTHVGYSGKCYRSVCEAARQLLDGTEIQECDWSNTLATCKEGDFVYLDPPYYGTQACYRNINHKHLIETLNYAEFNWLLSGYDNPLYEVDLQYYRRYGYVRNSEIKSSNTGVRTPILETVWMNYGV